MNWGTVWVRRAATAFFPDVPHVAFLATELLDRLVWDGGVCGGSLKHACAFCVEIAGKFIVSTDIEIQEVIKPCRFAPKRWRWHGDMWIMSRLGWHIPSLTSFDIMEAFQTAAIAAMPKQTQWIKRRLWQGMARSALYLVVERRVAEGVRSFLPTKVMLTAVTTATVLTAASMQIATARLDTMSALCEALDVPRDCRPMGVWPQCRALVQEGLSISSEPSSILSAVSESLGLQISSVQRAWQKGPAAMLYVDNWRPPNMRTCAVYRETVNGAAALLRTIHTSQRPLPRSSTRARRQRKR